MMPRKESGRRKSWPILVYCPDIFLEVMRKITKPLSRIVSLQAYSSQDLHYTQTFHLARVVLRHFNGGSFESVSYLLVV
jgi:hypothetical protein